jgi:predicted lipase
LTDTYLTRTWKGPTSGFKATKVIYDKKTDTNGYIGYHPSTSAIYVVFRGTQTLQNWITDLKFAKADYPYPRCSGCEVHKGFYQAEQAVINDVLAEVKRLRGLYPSYQVVVTGHSLGAALAQLTVVDLQAAGYPVVSYHIGCPRVGDADFSKFVQNMLPDIHRIVHDNDIVPQVPLQSMNFHHVAYEYFEDKNGAVKKCNNSGEDASCSDKYSLSQTSVDAHLVYLGIPVNCETVSTEDDWFEENILLRAGDA